MIDYNKNENNNYISKTDADVDRQNRKPISIYNWKTLTSTITATKM